MGEVKPTDLPSTANPVDDSTADQLSEQVGTTLSSPALKNAMPGVQSPPGMHLHIGCVNASVNTDGAKLATSSDALAFAGGAAAGTIGGMATNAIPVNLAEKPGDTTSVSPSATSDSSAPLGVHISGVDANSPPGSLEGFLYQALQRLSDDPTATASGSDDVSSDLDTLVGDDDSSSGASQPPQLPPTFGQAAQTIYNWMSTDSSLPKNQCIGPAELQDIANGQGIGAGASGDLRAAAREMLADGDKFQSELGGKDNLADVNDFAKYVANDNSTPLTDAQMQTLSILGRHEGDISLKTADIQSKIDDQSTPPDLKTALQQLKADPSLLTKVDAGKNGKLDGKFSGKDITSLINSHPELKAFNQAQALQFVQNYIPSDDTDNNPQPRPMTENDAMRELYRYSDYLPKNVTEQSLQDIVDGTGGEGKCPPQVIAAAQYFLQNKSQWRALAGSSGSIKRSSLLDAIARNVTLNQSENEAMDTVDKNMNVFFSSGDITDSSLQKLASDPKQSDAIKKAAQELEHDPLLFGVLDNGAHGHGGNLIYAADDRKISTKDFAAYKAHSKTAGQTASVPATHTPSTPEAAAATQAMCYGTLDQPAQKKSKGGGLLKFAQGLLHVLSKVVGFVGTVFSALGEIPGLGLIFKGAAAASSAISGQLDVASVAAGGGSKQDIANAEKQAGIDTAAGIASALIAPGVGGALVKGVESGVEKGVESGVTKAAVKDAVKDASKDEAKDDGKSEVEDKFNQSQS